MTDDTRTKWYCSECGAERQPYPATWFDSTTGERMTLMLCQTHHLPKYKFDERQGGYRLKWWRGREF